MRLWSIHPRYLDRIGLIALWREGLLAQKVLLGNTKGYTRHPQLDRFKNSSDPVGAIAAYLQTVAVHAASRGYSFNAGKIDARRIASTIAVPSGQIVYEFEHLMKKLSVRSPEEHRKLLGVKRAELHPLFHRVQGGVALWEKSVEL